MKEIQSIVNENKAIKKELEQLQSKINPLKEAEKEVFKVNSALADIKKDYPESVTINVYGEYYGLGVKKMQYTETEKNYRVFDVFVYLKDSILVLGKTDLEKYFSNEQLVPFFPEVKTLKEFINRRVIVQAACCISPYALFC